MKFEKFINRFLNGGIRGFETIGRKLRIASQHIDREFFERTDAVDVSARRGFRTEFLGECVGPRFGGWRQSGGGEVMDPPSGAMVLKIVRTAGLHRTKHLPWRNCGGRDHRRLVREMCIQKVTISLH